MHYTRHEKLLHNTSTLYDCTCISNNWQYDCMLNDLSRTTKEWSRISITDLLWEESTPRDSNADLCCLLIQSMEHSIVRRHTFKQCGLFVSRDPSKKIIYQYLHHFPRLLPPSLVLPQPGVDNGLIHAIPVELHSWSSRPLPQYLLDICIYIYVYICLHICIYY